MEHLQKIGYVKYDDHPPKKKVLADCSDGKMTWTARIGPEGGADQPVWWRPSLSKDELWELIVELKESAETARNEAYRKATKIAQKRFKDGEFTVTREIIKNATDYPEIPFDWEADLE